MFCVLVQDDVAKRIVASPGGKEYGALSVTMQLWGQCRTIKNVPRGMFVPVPGVDSCFVVAEKRKEVKEVCERLLKGVFAARRKTILNGLCIVYGINKQQSGEMLALANISAEVRPEQITVQQFGELATVISKIMQK